MKFRGVLFDLDGTLLDTIADLTDSMNIALNHFGFPGHDAESCKVFVGDGVEMFAFRALPENKRDQATVAECVTLMRQEYSKRGRGAVRSWGDPGQQWSIEDEYGALEAAEGCNSSIGRADAPNDAITRSDSSGRG